MATGKIVAAWKEGGTAYLAVSIPEGGKNVEYIGSAPLLDAEGKAKSQATLKAECVADIKAQRGNQAAGKIAMDVVGTVTL